jgi:hypothetical protein
VPLHAVIVSAVLRVYVDSGPEGDADVSMQVQNSSNAPALTTAAFNISSRTFLAPTVSWTATLPAGWNDSPSLVSLVQPVVNLAGWAAGNSILFKLVDADGGFEFRQYDFVNNGNTGEYRAQLLLTYELP